MDEATGKWLRLTIAFVQALEGNLSMNGGEKIHDWLLWETLYYLY